MFLTFFYYLCCVFLQKKRKIWRSWRRIASKIPSKPLHLSLLSVVKCRSKTKVTSSASSSAPSPNLLPRLLISPHSPSLTVVFGPHLNTDAENHSSSGGVRTEAVVNLWPQDQILFSVSLTEHLWCICREVITQTYSK